MTRHELRLGVYRGQMGAALAIIEAAVTHSNPYDGPTERQAKLLELVREEYAASRRDYEVADDS